MKRSLWILLAGVIVITGIFAIPMIQDSLQSFEDIDPTTEYSPIGNSDSVAVAVSPVAQTDSETDGEIYFSLVNNVSECSVRDPHSDYEVLETFTPSTGDTRDLPDTEVVLTCLSSSESSQGSEYLVLYKEYSDDDGSYRYNRYYSGTSE